MKIMKVIKLIEILSFFFLTIENKRNFLFKVAHDEVVFLSTVDLKFNIADSNCGVGQIHEERFCLS